MVSGVGIPSIDHPGFLLWEIIVSNVFDRVMAVFAGHRNPSALDLLLDSSDKTGPILTIQPRNIDPDENSVGAQEPAYLLQDRFFLSRLKMMQGVTCQDYVEGLWWEFFDGRCDITMEDLDVRPEPLASR